MKFEVTRLIDAVEFGARVSWEDWHLRHIHFGLTVAIYGLQLTVRVPKLRRKPLCFIRHKWGPWRIHPQKPTRDIRHCIRCGTSQERKAI